LIWVKLRCGVAPNAEAALDDPLIGGGSPIGMAALRRTQRPMMLRVALPVVLGQFCISIASTCLAPKMLA
jgi:hypothetical protein